MSLRYSVTSGTYWAELAKILGLEGVVGEETSQFSLVLVFSGHYQSHDILVLGRKSLIGDH